MIHWNDRPAAADALASAAILKPPTVGNRAGAVCRPVRGRGTWAAIVRMGQSLRRTDCVSMRKLALLLLLTALLLAGCRFAVVETGSVRIEAEEAGER